MPNEELSEERQKQILDAAITEFARNGFHATHMEDIAHASGLSKGAVCIYHKSKDAIIRALLHTLFSWEMRGVRAIMEGEGSAAERLLAITRMFADDLERMKVATPILLEFYAVAFRQPAVRDYLSQFYAELRVPLVGLIQQGVEHGKFRAVDPNEAALAWTALVEGLTLLWMVNLRGLAWRDHAEAAVRLLLVGLRALTTPGERRRVAL
jgi:AcrR family transcriptional regulator